MKNTGNSIKGGFILAITAMIWGLAFVAQNVGMDYIGAITFNGLRFLMGAAVLLPVILITDHFRRKRGTKKQRRRAKTTFFASLCAGTVLFVASTLQQIGVQYTTAGKAGFITAMYIVIVPVMGIFLKKKTSVLTWLSVIIAVAGMYLLCVDGKLTVSAGDIYVLMGSVFWAVHILVIDYFSDKTDCMKLACGQFIVSGIISLPLMFVFERVSFSSIADCAVPLLYAGILSCGVAYTLQPLGQRYASPTLASIVMSLESVFAVIGGCLILRETMTLREGLGCVIMLVAVLMAQISPELFKTKKKS